MTLLISWLVLAVPVFDCSKLHWKARVCGSVGRKTVWRFICDGIFFIWSVLAGQFLSFWGHRLVEVLSMFLERKQYKIKINGRARERVDERGLVGNKYWSSQRCRFVAILKKARLLFVVCAFLETLLIKVI